MNQQSQSRWEDICNQLERSGFEVYAPGTKLGECIRPYIVVKSDGAGKKPSFSTEEMFIAVMVYVPKASYSKLEPLVRETKKVLKPLYPGLIPLGQQTPSFYDDTVKAHMVSIEYKYYVKM